jgi:hypothetical protein
MRLMQFGANPLIAMCLRRGSDGIVVDRRHHRLTTGQLAAAVPRPSARPVDPCVPYLPTS